MFGMSEALGMTFGLASGRKSKLYTCLAHWSTHDERSVDLVADDRAGLLI